MEPLSAHQLQQVLARLRVGLELLYGSRLTRLVLFGSYARGEAHAESDLDVLAVLEGEVNPAKEIYRTNTLATELSTEYRCVLNLLVISASQYEQSASSFINNLRAEEVVV